MSLADELYDAFRANKSTKDYVFRGDDETFHSDFLKTGLAPVDYVLSGGFPYGRMVELYGNFSSGKTYVLYLALAANQKAGGVSVLLESEGAFDKEFFRLCGGDPESLIVFPVTTVEETFNHIYKVCEFSKEKRKSGDDTPFAVGWDSIAQTGTAHLQETGMDKRDMSKPFAMSQGAALVTTIIHETRVCVIATNQIRDLIGSNDSATHTPGGRSWKFACSQRVELRFDGGSKGSLINTKVNGKDEMIGRQLKLTVTKNKCGVPLLEIFLPFYNHDNYLHPIYGYPTTFGVDKCEALFDFYSRSRYYIVNTVTRKERVIQSTSPGWYSLHPRVDPTEKKFRESEWATVLTANPILWDLIYVTKPITDDKEPVPTP